VEAKRSIIVFVILSLISAVILKLSPEYIHGLSINGLIHRSFFSAIFLLVISVPAICYSLFYFLGATPRSYDISRYPLFVVPVVIVLAAYGFILFRLTADGAPLLNWSLITHSFQDQSWQVEVWQNGWPVWVRQDLLQIGIGNHILGTLLLMALSSLISLPIGIGVGIYVHQYAGTRMTEVIKFSTTALRAISGIILVVILLSLTRWAAGPLHGTIFEKIIDGFGYYANGALVIGRSSFLAASMFISLLIIPIIAKVTEEGLSSLPKDITEGSVALGASKEHTLLRLLLPWSFPNIITGLVLGCAEAAGSLTVIFLVAGNGQFGINPLRETTSLAYLIYDCQFGTELGDTVQRNLGQYQFTAAFILLIITIGLTVTALIMKNKLAKRYKGA
jgi:ABC-type phosphate transport system permease subunit